MLTRILILLAILSGQALAAAPAAAQFRNLDSSRPTQAETQRERVSGSLVVYEGDAVAGGEVTLGVVLTVQEKWKIQAGVGSGDEAEPYIPTSIDLTLPVGWEAASPRWPAAFEFEMGVEGFTETLRGYEGTIVVAIPVTVPADAAAGEHEISATVTYQACDDEMCEFKASIAVTGAVNVVADAADATAATLDDTIAAQFEKTLSREQPQTPPGETTAAAPGVPTPSAGPPAGSTFFGLSVPHAEGLLGLLMLAVLSAIGGFILNLTPCVLPVIPIKIMTLQQHANKPGKNLVLGLWMFAGVVAFWAGIGLPVAFLAGVTDPSQAFGIWWVTFSIGAIIAIMGVGIMGMFSIQLPQSVYSINPKADTPWGSFGFGVMTAVLGLPCFGFVAGALLAGAATLPPSTIMVIFTALGIGMGLPYMVLSAKPSLVAKIPRTGPASELVKQVMGLLLLAAAAYFIGSGLIALVSDKPYLARQLHWWAVALFAAVAAFWLIVRTFQITPKAGPRVSFGVIGLIVGGFAVVYAVDSTTRAKDNWLVQQQADASPRGYLAGFWNEFSPAALENAREDGKIVVLDFTAEWCLICKALKASVLDRDPVRSELNTEGVVKFTVDLTSDSAPGWPLLRDELGQTGIPLLAIYTPGKDEPWQGNSYTAQQVLHALDQARNGRAEMLARN